MMRYGIGDETERKAESGGPRDAPAVYGLAKLWHRLHEFTRRIYSFPKRCSSAVTNTQFTLSTM